MSGKRQQPGEEQQARQQPQPVQPDGVDGAEPEAGPARPEIDLRDAGADGRASFGLG